MGLQLKRKSGTFSPPLSASIECRLGPAPLYLHLNVEWDYSWKIRWVFTYIKNGRVGPSHHLSLHLLNVDLILMFLSGNRNILLLLIVNIVSYFWFKVGHFFLRTGPAEPQAGLGKREGRSAVAAIARLRRSIAEDLGSWPSQSTKWPNLGEKLSQNKGVSSWKKNIKFLESEISVKNSTGRSKILTGQVKTQLDKPKTQLDEWKTQLDKLKRNWTSRKLNWTSQKHFIIISDEK